MWWKIALFALIVAGIGYVGHLYIKSLKDFAKITSQLDKKDDETANETESEE